MQHVSLLWNLAPQAFVATVAALAVPGLTIVVDQVSVPQCFLGEVSGPLLQFVGAVAALLLEAQLLIG